MTIADYTQEMKVGYIVVPAPGKHLRSGASIYDHAIVACVDPFVLVSEYSDMCWITMLPSDVRARGVATPEAINAIQHRLEPEQQVRKPCAESLLSLQLGCGLTLASIGTHCEAVDLNETVPASALHGPWKDEVAKSKNPSYGWLFEYDAESNFWKAKFCLPERLLEVAKHNAAGNRVHTMRPIEGTHALEVVMAVVPKF